MDNNYSPLLYFNEDTSLEDSINKVALDEIPIQEDLKKKAKNHYEALIDIINQMTDEVCLLYIHITMYVILYYIIQNMLDLLDQMKQVFCTAGIIPSPPWTKTSRFTPSFTTSAPSTTIISTTANNTINSSSSSSQAPPLPPYSYTPSSKPYESLYNLRESTLLVCGIKRKAS